MPLILALIRFAARRPVLVIVLAVLLGAASGVLAVTQIRVTTDVDGLFAASLPWKQREAELKRLFPQFEDLLVAVVDADSPEAADATAAGLAAALAADPHFRSVRRPDASPYLDREGLLFLDQPVLETLLNQTIDAQPFLGQLAADPSARGLFAALSLIAAGRWRSGQADLTGRSRRRWQAFRPRRSARMRSRGRRSRCRGRRLLSGSADGAGRAVSVRAGEAEAGFRRAGAGRARRPVALRAAAAGLPFVKSGALAHVRLTGAMWRWRMRNSRRWRQGAARGADRQPRCWCMVWLTLAVRSLAAHFADRDRHARSWGCW